MGRKRTGRDVVCDGCGEQEFYVPGWRLRQQENHYCSHQCYVDHDVAQRVGEKNPNFQKDDPTYAALHLWAARHFEQVPCEHCGHEGPSEPRLEWARKHGTWSREREDWLRLCRTCHFEYDREIHDSARSPEEMARRGRLGAKARWR